MYFGERDRTFEGRIYIHFLHGVLPAVAVVIAETP